MKQEGFIICNWLYGQANGIIIFTSKIYDMNDKLLKIELLFSSEWAV